MLRSYLLATYRNLLKHKAYSLVNVFGLALGMAACFFIFQYVNFESNYDKFNENADRLYRVIMVTEGAIRSESAVTHNGVAPIMKKDYPEIEDYTRFVNYNLLFNVREVSYSPANGDIKTFHVDRLFIADSSFFSVFSYPLVAGDKKSCLTDKTSIVLSESLTKKYFGNEPALGKTLKFNGRGLFTVTGVFKDVPDNSHIKFDMLMSMNAEPARFDNEGLDWPEFYNYVLLKPGTDVSAFERKLSSFADKHMKQIMETYKFRANFYLQKVTEIHLNSHYEKEAEVNGSKQEVNFLSIIGVFILVIAWINYINLCTAKSLERSKEVGLRKVVGASRKQVFMQFLVESAVINLLALLVAIAMIITAWPFITTFIGKDITAGFFATGLGAQPSFWMTFMGIFIAGTLIVGIYPALVLSSFKPVSLFKSVTRTSSAGLWLRRGLVTFQYALSILLIAATIIVYKQLLYSRNQQLGYDAKKLIVAKAPANTWQKASDFKYMKELVMESKFADKATSSSDVPGEQIRYQNVVRRTYNDKGAGITTNLIEVDHNFIAAYNIPIIAGRDFTKGDSVNLLDVQNPNIIVNEKLANDLGFVPASTAANQKVIYMFGAEDKVCNIIGVMKNYHQRSLKDKYEPIILYTPQKTMWKYVTFRVGERNAANSLAAIQKTYKEVFPASPFEYVFLDDYFNMQYAGDERLGKVFMLFAILAIIVACLGLWGLSSFTLKLRVKEVGIRKVLGASVRSLLFLLTRDYLKLTAIAALLTLPLMFMLSKRWLENFAFHFQPTLLLLLIPSILLLVINLVTIIFQTLKAALQNPTKSLKLEQ